LKEREGARLGEKKKKKNHFVQRGKPEKKIRTGDINNARKCRERSKPSGRKRREKIWEGEKNEGREKKEARFEVTLSGVARRQSGISGLLGGVECLNATESGSEVCTQEGL